MEYEFSAPMPFSRELVNALAGINNQVKKSRITSLYFSLPASCSLFTIFEQYRNDFEEHSDFSFWKDLMNYSLDLGMDFIYNLNNPKNLPIETPEFEKELEKLDSLLNELRSIGVNKLRVSNHKLLWYLNRRYKDFTLYASTSFEYKLVKEYQHFIDIHPEVKQIVPSHDVNKNFRLLENLRKTKPKVDIEVIVNEGCIGGCAMRYDHSCEIMGRGVKARSTKLSNGAYSEFCSKSINKNPLLYLCKSQIIYPWEIEEYGKIGVTKFKIAGREDFKRDMGKSVNSYLLYLKGVDNINNIKEEAVNSIIHHVGGDPFFNQFKIKEVKNLLPNIKHYVKAGHLCVSDCGNTCTYCYKCAQKLEKLRKKKECYVNDTPLCTMSRPITAR